MGRSIPPRSRRGDRPMVVVRVAVSQGETVLIENIEESVDPVLDPIIGRNTIKKVRLIPVLILTLSYSLRSSGLEFCTILLGVRIVLFSCTLASVYFNVDFAC